MAMALKVFDDAIREAENLSVQNTTWRIVTEWVNNNRELIEQSTDRLGKDFAQKLTSILMHVSVTLESKVLHLVDMQLDSGTYQASVGGAEPCQLSAAQFHVLELLFSKGGELVTYLEIMDAAKTSNMSTVTTYIWQLRKKIGRGRIKGVYGKGYYYHAYGDVDADTG
jgi:DNA-binding response OmpR family regulator